ncbi:hypothetical protein, partial [Endozoicomonas sp. SESOKO3]
ENDFESEIPGIHIRPERDRLIADSWLTVGQLWGKKPVIIELGLSDVRQNSSASRLGRVMAQSYGLALLLKLRASVATAAEIVRAMEIWQTDFHNDPDGDYGFDNVLKLRQVPEDSDPLYKTIVVYSDNRELKFAQGSVDDFRQALGVLFQEKRLAVPVRNVFRSLEAEPGTAVGNFAQGLVELHTDFWKQMLDSELRSALQLQQSDYQLLKNRITSTGLPAEVKDSLLSDLGDMENPPDKTPYTGTISSHYLDVYNKGIKKNSPGIISEVAPGSYGDKGSASKIAILFSGRFIKYVMENNVPSKDLFLLHSDIIRTLRWLRTTPEFKAFSEALKEGQNQTFGDLQTLVNRGVIDSSVGTGFDQVKIPNSVRLLLVITPPGSSSITAPEPVLVKNTGCVLKIDPSQYFTEGKILAQQYHTLSSLMARYIVAANLLKGVSRDSETIRKSILDELDIKKLPENIKAPAIPVDTYKGQIGLEIEYSLTSVDTESRVDLAYTKFTSDERVSPDYHDLALTTDSARHGSVIEIVTGPKPLRDYLSESSALFRATNILHSGLAKIPESGITVSDFVQAYNNELLENDPKDDLKKFRLINNPQYENNKISLLPKARGKKPLRYHVQVNIGVDLSGIGDITSWIGSLIAPSKRSFLRQFFQWCQYKAFVISERLNLNSDLLKSMFTIHLFKQALDSSTEDFLRGKLGVKNSPITNLEGLLRLGTADFLMTVISDLDATQLKS